jgi:hypothetical protein
MLKNPALLFTATLILLISDFSAKADSWTAWCLINTDSTVLYRTHAEKSGGTPNYWHDIQFRNTGTSDKTVEIA